MHICRERYNSVQVCNNTRYERAIDASRACNTTHFMRAIDTLLCATTHYGVCESDTLHDTGELPSALHDTGELPELLVFEFIVTSVWFYQFTSYRATSVWVYQFTSYISRVHWWVINTHIWSKYIVVWWHKRSSIPASSQPHHRPLRGRESLSVTSGVHTRHEQHDAWEHHPNMHIWLETTPVVSLLLDRNYDFAVEKKQV
jgi:hypothetical protein